MPIEDFEGNVPPIGGGQGYTPPGLPPVYKPPEMVFPSPPVQEFKPIPENMFGYFMLLYGL